MKCTHTLPPILLIGLLLTLSSLSTVQAATDCAADTEIPKAQCETLLALYNSTNGANWTNKTGWNETNTPCNWNGIFCGNGNVLILNLSEAGNLKGSLPNLSALTGLMQLGLARNQLTGTIPDLSQLTNLQFLDLSYNQLTGTIPDLSQLTNLQTLYLSMNQLTGTIPDLSQLTEVTVVSLYSNQLSGPIPSLNTLTKLTNLSFAYNLQLCKDPNANYGTRTEVDAFPICGLTFALTVTKTGTGTGEVKTADTTINCGTTCQSDYTPNSTVTLTATPATDSTFAGWSEACTDTTADVTVTMDAAKTCTAIFNKTVTTIDCAEVTEIPKAQCEALLALYSDTNGPNWSPKDGWNVTTTPCTTPWEGVKCSESGNVPEKVIEIDLTSHKLKGTLPDLSALTGLQKLQLGTNQLTGAFPDWSKLTDLQVLDLSNNQFSGLIPELNGLVNLDSLSLKDNQLEGPIPALDKLLKTKLLTFELSGNSTDTPLCLDPTRKATYGEWAVLDPDLNDWVITSSDDSDNKFSICMGTISGVKFNDILDNGRQDAGEQGLQGETITVWNSATDKSFTTWTGPNGDYQIAVPYGINTIRSDNPVTSSYTQQTTPVRIPPLVTHLNIETSWTKKDRDGINFGVHGLYTLTLSKKSNTGNDQSKITAEAKGPEGVIYSVISCEADNCPLYYRQGDQVTLKADAAFGSNLAAWQGDCEAPAGSNTSDVMMDSNQKCTAYFEGFNCANINQISPGECEALLSLFISTEGDTAWTNSDGWQVSLNPCDDWTGVDCANGKVSAINLADKQLTGKLPSDMSALPALQTFDVSDNNDLTGPLPPTLTKIATLTQLNLSKTSVCQSPNLDYGVWETRSEVAGLQKCEQLPPVADFNIVPPGGSLTLNLDASPLAGKDEYKWTTACASSSTATEDQKQPGPTATGMKTPITFPQSAFCDITLTVTAAGKTDSYTRKQVKLPAKSLSVAKTGYGDAFYIIPEKLGGLTGYSVYLEASSSYDPDGEIVSYNWTTSCGPSATGMQTVITFPKDAACEITLTVVDDGGVTDSVMQRVIVPIAGLMIDKDSRNPENPGSGQVTMKSTDPTKPGDAMALNCFPDICVQQQSNFYPGATVELKARPYEGYIFTGWGDDCAAGSYTLALDASFLNYPEGSKYNWTVSCTTTDTSELIELTATGVGPHPTIPLTQPRSANCNVTLQATHADTKVTKTFTTSAPVAVPITGLTSVKDGLNDAFRILPYTGFSIMIDESSKSCTAYFDVDPTPPNLPKLEVELWNTKTNLQDQEAGRVVDNRLTINLGDGNNKWWTYYTPDKTVKLKSLPSHQEKVNSGAKTYWEFTKWNCYKKANGEPVEPFINPTLRDALITDGTLKAREESLKKKPQFRFVMPSVDTVCQAYFNSELDIAGQELRTKTYKEGTIDTGELPSKRYPMDLGDNAARLREAMYWAQPAILMVNTFVDLNSPEKMEATWPTQFLDKEFFRPSPVGADGKNTEVGKDYTKSVKIRPKDAEVVGFDSTGIVLGYFIEARVMLVKKDGVVEEVPVLVTYETSSSVSAETRRGTRAPLKPPPPPPGTVTVYVGSSCYNTKSCPK